MNATGKRHTSPLLFLLLGLGALLCSLFPIQMIGITAGFSSLFFLVTGRLYGLRLTAVQVALVYAIVLYATELSWILISVLILEIFTTLMLFELFKRRLGVLFPCMLYWLFVGTPILLYAYHEAYGELDFRIQLFTLSIVVNGLFNALAADLCRNYLPVLLKRATRAGCTGDERIRLSGFLLHFTLFSMIGSAFLFLIHTSSLAQRTLFEDTAVQGERLTDELQQAFAGWTAEQYRDPVQSFRELLERASIPADDAVLLDQDGSFIMDYSSNMDQAEYLWTNRERWTTLTPELHVWTASPSWDDIPGGYWRSTALIHEIHLEPYTLYMKLSSSRYVRGILKIYSVQADYLFYTALMFGLFGLFLHRFVVRSITRLARTTRDIPSKLQEGEPVYWADSGIGEIQELTENFRTVTETLQLKLNETRAQAYYDMLTGLPNRRHFTDHLASRLQQADGASSLAVFFIDLDRFKPINDAHGHAVGDALLLQVGIRLMDILREHGTFLARLGGDEFVVVSSAGDRNRAADLGERILQALCEPFQVDALELQIGASIGIALSPEHGREPGELVEHADQAMYQAKQGGRSRLCFYEPEHTLP